MITFSNISLHKRISIYIIIFISIIKTKLMDLQFLTAQQLQLTLRLCDILSMQDMTVAAAVLANYDWNIENAINDIPLGSYKSYNQQPTLVGTYSNEQEEQFLEEEDNYEYIKQQNIQEKRKFFEEEHISLVPLSKTLSEPRNQLNLLEFHKMLAKDSKIHRGEYLKNIMSNSEALCKKILQSSPENKRKYIANRWKIQNNSKFINNLYTNYQPRWNFTFGTFFLNLTRSYLQGKHLLVYIHSLNPENQRKYKKVLDLVFRQREISNFVNENCIVYGIFDNSDEYDILQKYAPLKDLPAFAIFTMNKEKRQERFVSQFKLSSKNEVFLEWLAESIGIKLSRRGSQAGKEKVEEVKPKNDYNAHTYLREQQDELYFQLEKTYNQKRQLSLQRREKIHSDQENLQKRIIEYSKQVQPESGEKVMEVRFRMANTGQTKSRRFCMDDKAEKLFTFVDCCCRDNFQEKFNNFDLVQTHPPLVLSGLRQKSLLEIFEGSQRENIIVRQI